MEWKDFVLYAKKDVEDLSLHAHSENAIAGTEEIVTVRMYRKPEGLPEGSVLYYDFPTRKRHAGDRVPYGPATLVYECGDESLGYHLRASETYGLFYRLGLDNLG